MNQPPPHRPPPFDPTAFAGGPHDPVVEGPPAPFGPPPGQHGHAPRGPFHRTVPGQTPLQVVGGVEAPPRAEVIAFVRQCHKGQRNRLNGELEPWTTLVLTHLDTRLTCGQWDVTPDEDDIELARLIDDACNTHGVPLARRNGTQTYQIDCYFGGTQTPRAHQIVEVDAPAGMHGAQNALLGRGAAAVAARGQMPPNEHQVYRHNEALMQMAVGWAQANQASTMDQLAEARAEVRYYREQIAAIEAREQALKDAEHKYKLDMYNAQRSAARKDWIIAKLAGYAPVFLAKLDQRISGMMALSADEKEGQALGAIKTILGKLSDGNGGAEKLAQIAEILGLSDDELGKVTDLGKLLWLEEQRTKLHQEAERVGRGAAFNELGKGVTEIAAKAIGAPEPKKG